MSIHRAHKATAADDGAAPAAAVGHVAEGSGSAGLSVRHLSKVYTEKRGNSVEAIHDVSLDVTPGDFVSIVGPSGCGKSTLLYILAGFLSATSGEVLADGVPVTRPGPDRAIVFQDYSLFPWKTALGNVTYGLRETGMGRRERELKGRELLATVGLGGAEHRYPHQLSGGMKQRLAIARTLAVDPDYLLMDEPLGALDALTRAKMQDEVNRLWEATHTTVVLVTHSVEEAIFLSNRIYVMSPRPARVLDVIDVDFDRPRSREAVLANPGYASLHAHIWELLAHDDQPGLGPS